RYRLRYAARFEELFIKITISIILLKKCVNRVCINVIDAQTSFMNSELSTAEETSDKQAEMSSWMRVINASLPSSPGDASDHSPSAPKGLTRAMTMPPVSPNSAMEGMVTLRNKEGKEKDREKRFSFFKKK
ncbi:hypothetical protein AB205_0089730, partial [Aquarana catesbeiana]